MRSRCNNSFVSAPPVEDPSSAVTNLWGPQYLSSCMVLVVLAHRIWASPPSFLCSSKCGQPFYGPTNSFVLPVPTIFVCLYLPLGCFPFLQCVHMGGWVELDNLTFVPLCMFVCPSFYLSIYLSVCPICRLSCLPVCLSCHCLSVLFCVCLSLRSFCPSVCLFVCLSLPPFRLDTDCLKTDPGHLSACLVSLQWEIL